MGVSNLHSNIEMSTAQHEIVNLIKYCGVWERAHFKAMCVFIYLFSVFVCGACAFRGINGEGQRTACWFFPSLSTGN